MVAQSCGVWVTLTPALSGRPILVTPMFLTPFFDFLQEMGNFLTLGHIFS